MWILIITLIGFSSQSGHAVSSVTGFTSDKTCMVAAGAWIEQSRKAGGMVSARALCVKA